MLHEDTPNWSVQEQNTMYYICLPLCILSVIGSSFIIANFLLFPDLRSFSFKLVLFIALSDFMRSVAMGLPAYYHGHLNEYLCWIQAILGNMAGLSTTMWNCCVAISIKFVFSSSDPLKNIHTERLFRKMFVIVTSLTILLSIPPIFPLNKEHAYALAGQWCWIGEDTNWQIACRIIDQYSVQILCGVYILYVYWWFMRKLFRSQQQQHLMNETIGRLKWYPVVLVISYVPGIVNRFSQILFSTPPKYELSFSQFATVAICGFLDALVYSWTKAVSSKWKTICCGGKNREDSSNLHYADLSEFADTYTDQQIQ